MIVRLLGFALWVLVSWGFGLRVLRLLRMGPCGTAARGVLAIGTALAIDVFVGLILGWSSALSATTTLALLVAQAGIAITTAREMKESLLLLPRVPRVLWLLMPMVALTLVCALAPYTSHDGPNEHFPLAKVAARSGDLHLDDELRYSANGGLHVLYMLAFTIGREEEANLVWFLFVATLPVAAYAAGRELFSPRAGVCAAFLAALFPYTDTACVAMMEKPAAYFLLLGLMTAGLFMTRGSWRWALLAGLFTGLCIQARPMCVPAVAVAVVLLLRRPWKRELAVFALALVVSSAPWPMWIFVETGSPYPIQTAADELATIEGSTPTGTSFAKLHVAYVWKLFSPGALGAAGMALLLTAVLLRGRPAIVSDLLRMLGIAVALHYLGTVTLGVHMLGGAYQARYFLSQMLPLTVVIGAWAWEALRTRLRGASAVVAVAIAVQAFCPFLAGIRRVAWVSPYIRGRDTREQYLRSVVPSYTLIEDLNARVKPDESVVAAIPNQGFLEIRYHYVDQFKQDKLGRDGYLELMKRTGARYLAVSMRVARHVTPGEELREVFRSPAGVVYERVVP